MQKIQNIEITNQPLEKPVRTLSPTSCVQFKLSDKPGWLGYNVVLNTIRSYFSTTTTPTLTIETYEGARIYFVFEDIFKLRSAVKVMEELYPIEAVFEAKDYSFSLNNKKNDTNKL